MLRMARLNRCCRPEFNAIFSSGFWYGMHWLVRECNQMSKCRGFWGATWTRGRSTGEKTSRVDGRVFMHINWSIDFICFWLAGRAVDKRTSTWQVMCFDILRRSWAGIVTSLFDSITDSNKEQQYSALGPRDRTIYQTRLTETSGS